MIPRADILAWRDAGYIWRTDAMVEQDLILSRILVDLFRDPGLSRQFVFRGGTALHKLCFSQPMRYSEDVDLVQRDPGPIGPVFDALRNALSPWLGEKPSRKQGPGVVNLIYRVQSEDSPPLPLRIKIEINTREHFQMLPLRPRTPASIRMRCARALGLATCCSTSPFSVGQRTLRESLQPSRRFKRQSRTANKLPATDHAA
jgi:hypothetical protein